MSLTLCIQLISSWKPLQRDGENLSVGCWADGSDLLGINRLPSNFGGVCGVWEALAHSTVVGLPRFLGWEVVQLYQPCKWDNSEELVGVFPAVGLCVQGAGSSLAQLSERPGRRCRLLGCSGQNLLGPSFLHSRKHLKCSAKTSPSGLLKGWSRQTGSIVFLLLDHIKPKI